MDYEKLKEVIAKQIKENGRREITGPVLQAVLMAMVDSLGEVYSHTYTDEEKAQARANIDALSNHNGEITKEKLSLEVQAILNDVANKQNITDESLATIAKTIVGAINEVYNGGLKDASIATSKIKDGAITKPKLDTDLVNVINSAVQPSELASAIATALASYVAKEDIVDITGSATDKVMSQHGVTEAINGVKNKVTELEGKVGDLNGSVKNYVAGKRINMSGQGQNDPSACATDFIPYNQGNSVGWTWGDTIAKSYNLCFYDSNKQFILNAYFEANKASGTRVISVEEITTYAPTAAYIRATISATSANAKVEIGDVVAWTKTEDAGLSSVKREISELDKTLSTEINTIKTGQAQNYVSGKYLSVVNGQVTEIEEEGWGITDFISYTYDNQVEWKYADNGSAPEHHIVFYNSNKEYITNAYWGTSYAGTKIITSEEIRQYAQGAAFIRASFKIGDECYIKEKGAIIWYPQEGINGLQNLQDDITEIDTRVTALENANVDDSVAILNKFKDSAIVSIAAKIGQQIPKVKDNFLCFLHISDIHGDVERMKRAIAFANSQNNITAILVTGDFAQSDWISDGFEKCFTELYQTANIPMLPVIGNHDVGLKNKIYNPENSNQAVGARFISPFMSDLGCVQGGTDAGYYYKDFSSFNVRLIVVNEYEMPRIPNAGNTELKYSIWGRYFSQAQADWLVSTLNSVQSGWSVIIAMHQLIDVFSKYDNEFKGAVNYSNADVDLAQDGILQDIVDAYITRGTLTKTYSVSGADTTEVPDVLVSADFSKANGDFICYINGHTHNDGTGQSSYATSKQVNINVTTGSANTASQAVYDDLYRDNDTIAQDAFNLVAFDTISKKIRMLRIGANVTIDMKRRDYALIPYL